MFYILIVSLYFVIKYARLRIEITGKCNLLCKYCYNEKFNSSKISNKEISLSQIKTLIDEGCKLGINNVLLIGGEPLLHPDIIDILDYITKKKCSLSITTNGTIITDRLLSKLRTCKISRISVSLDGFSAHNEVRIGSNYLKVVENIRRLLKITPHVHVLTVINERSAQDLLKLYSLLKKIGIEEWAPSHVFYHGRFLDNESSLGIKDYNHLFRVYQRLLKIYFKDKKPFRLSIHNVYNSEILKHSYGEFQLDSHPCNYYFDDTLAVKPNMDLVLCPNDSSIKANILDAGGLKEAIKIRDKNEFFNIQIRDIPECSNCRYLHLCGAGCRGESKRFLGSYLAPDPMSCIFMPKFEKEILPLLPVKERNKYQKVILESKPFPKVPKK